MRKRVVIVVGAALAAAMPALMAQSIHKCVARSGQVSYQSRPCAADARTEWARDAAPEPSPSAERRSAMRKEKARRAVESDYLARLAGQRRGRPAGHAISTSHDPDACEAARRHRDDVLGRVGLERTFELLRRLDDRVARACR